MINSDPFTMIPYLLRMSTGVVELISLPPVPLGETKEKQ